MLPVHQWILCGLGAIAGSAVFAQPAPTPPDVDESKIPEWVKRQARSPYKVIIESNTVRAKPVTSRDDTNGTKLPPRKAPLAAATPAAPVPTRAEALATAPAPAPEPLAEGAASAVQGESADAQVVAAIAVQAPLPEVANAILNPNANATTTAASPEPASLLVVASVGPKEPAPLQLVNRVEPLFPTDLIDDRFNPANVVVGFTVNPDGEVVNLSVTSTSDSRLNRSVLRAVRAWRYAPIEAPRQHAVRFDFTTQ